MAGGDLMATKYSGNNDHYVRAPEKETLRRLMRIEKITMTQMAYELRVNRSYLSGMFGTCHKMSHVYLIAIQMILLKARVARQAAERARLTKENV
jgi:hypothetical protein